MKAKIFYSCNSAQVLGVQECVNIYDLVSIQDNQLPNGNSIMLEYILAFIAIVNLTVPIMNYF